MTQEGGFHPASPQAGHLRPAPHPRVLGGPQEVSQGVKLRCLFLSLLHLQKMQFSRQVGQAWREGVQSSPWEQFPPKSRDPLQGAESLEGREAVQQPSVVTSPHLASSRDFLTKVDLQPTAATMGSEIALGVWGWRVPQTHSEPSSRGCPVATLSHWVAPPDRPFSIPDLCAPGGRLYILASTLERRNSGRWGRPEVW